MTKDVCLQVDIFDCFSSFFLSASTRLINWCWVEKQLLKSVLLSKMYNVVSKHKWLSPHTRYEKSLFVMTKLRADESGEFFSRAAYLATNSLRDHSWCWNVAHKSFASYYYAWKITFSLWEVLSCQPSAHNLKLPYWYAIKLPNYTYHITNNTRFSVTMSLNDII